MPELMILNPIGGKRKTKRKAKRRAAPAAKRKSRSSSHARRAKRAAPVVVHVTRSATVKKKHRSHTKHRKTRKHAHHFKANPITGARKHRRSHRRHTFKRNPIGGIGAVLMGSLMPAAVGAGSAIAFDVALGYLPLPPTWRQGWTDSLVRLGGVAVMGAGLAMFAPRKIAEMVTAGVLTVELNTIAKNTLKTHMPSLPLSGISAYPAVAFAPRPAMTAAGAPGLSTGAPEYLGSAPSFLGESEEVSPMAGGMGAYAYGY